MTADAAGVSERERLARTLYESRVRGLGSDWDKPWFTDNVKESWRREADYFLAAGFGDVAQAKAEAARDERIIWALYLWSVVEDSMEDAVSVHDRAIDEAFQTVAGYLIANIARGVTIEDVAAWGLDEDLIKTARRMPSLKREHPASEHHEIDAVLARATEYRTPSANGGAS